MLEIDADNILSVAQASFKQSGPSVLPVLLCTWCAASTRTYEKTVVRDLRQGFLAELLIVLLLYMYVPGVLQGRGNDAVLLSHARCAVPNFDVKHGVGHAFKNRRCAQADSGHQSNYPILYIPGS